jgi:branched-chain amino acid transport system ATP-binding protein
VSEPTSPAPPLLEVRQLSKHFGGLIALDGLDLELHAAEILGVIGPNGAGKSTLFSLITGSQPPSAGEVWLGSRRLTGLPAHRVVRAGVVRTHQIVRPFAQLSVLENVAVGARCAARRSGTRDVRERARRELAFTGLDAQAARLPATLTLAGRKRLELARALATEPRVLLLDEVIAGVNPAEAVELAALIRRIVDERGVSLIITEHVLPAVMTLCDRLVVLDRGRSIASGSPAQVVRRPEVIEAYLGRDQQAEP